MRSTEQQQQPAETLRRSHESRGAADVVLVGPEPAGRDVPVAVGPALLVHAGAQVREHAPVALVSLRVGRPGPRRQLLLLLARPHSHGSRQQLLLAVTLL